MMPIGPSSRPSRNDPKGLGPFFLRLMSNVMIPQLIQIRTVVLVISTTFRDTRLAVSDHPLGLSPSESLVCGLAADAEGGADHRPRVAGGPRRSDSIGERGVSGSEGFGGRGDAAHVAGVTRVGRLDVKLVEPEFGVGGLLSFH